MRSLDCKTHIKASYLITFRDADGSRLPLLKTVTAWLSTMPSIEVIVVEQGVDARLEAENLGPNARAVFVHNDGPFKRCSSCSTGVSSPRSSAGYAGSIARRPSSVPWIRFIGQGSTFQSSQKNSPVVRNQWSRSVRKQKSLPVLASSPY